VCEDGEDEGETMKIVMLGAPGAGKGTQAKKLVEKLGVPQISTGDILRGAVRDETEHGRAAKRFMDEGKLVPDDIILAIVKERLAKDDCRDGYILDGFPRNIAQAEAMDEMGIGVDKAVCVEVPKDALVERLTGRRSCPSCGAMYHVVFRPPAREGICDECGNELVQRSDDNEETVMERLEVYEKNTMPLLQHYEDAHKLVSVDGTRPIDEVFRGIIDRLEA
jgi:adenylate kinase